MLNKVLTTFMEEESHSMHTCVNLNSWQGRLHASQPPRPLRAAFLRYLEREMVLSQGRASGISLQRHTVVATDQGFKQGSQGPVSRPRGLYKNYTKCPCHFGLAPLPQAEKPRSPHKPPQASTSPPALVHELCHLSLCFQGQCSTQNPWLIFSIQS